jgi:hypothetical protein
MSLDLETNAVLIERIAASLRHIGHDVIDIAQDAEDTGHPRIADRLGQLLSLIDAAQVIPEVLAARDAFRANPPKGG